MRETFPLAKAPTVIRCGVIAMLVSLLLPIAVPRDLHAETIPCPDAMGRYIVSLYAERQISIWIGTEDDGVWRYLLSSQRWVHYTTQNGLGDNSVYAIGGDIKGRIWIGHLNHGVSIFNGDEWRTYDSISGPMGERVFSISTNESTGDIWVSTNCGLTRFDVSANAWMYCPFPAGISSEQGSRLAFTRSGDLLVGTANCGIALSERRSQYARWTMCSQPQRNAIKAKGIGLPSNLINDLTVARSGAIYAATAYGVGMSLDEGQTWTFIRGRDWKDSDSTDSPQGTADALSILPETFATAIVEDLQGRIWVGFRKAGYAILSPDLKILESSMPTNGGEGSRDYVSALCSSPHGEMIIGWYGGGADIISVKTPEIPAVNSTPGKKDRYSSPYLANGQCVDLPPSSAPLTDKEVDGLMQTLAMESPSRNGASAARYWSDDWTSQGDWVGRYGREYAVLCAANSPTDHEVSYGQHFEVSGSIGPQHADDDGLRRWVHWVKTDDHRSLWDPKIGYRRQAEWDDHGEAYAMSSPGPDIWVHVGIAKPGIHRVSLYFFNKDGHSGPNRYRDFLIDLLPYQPSKIEAEKGTSIAQCRVNAFWGGVYKSFVVSGPNQYWLRIAKNSSFNTIVSAVFIDPVPGQNEENPPRALPMMGGLFYNPSAASLPQSDAYLRRIESAWNALGKISTQTSRISASSWRRLLYRSALLHVNDHADVPDSWRWAIPLWTDSDRTTFLSTMHLGWDQQMQVYNESHH